MSGNYMKCVYNLKLNIFVQNIVTREDTERKMDTPVLTIPHIWSTAADFYL